MNKLWIFIVADFDGTYLNAGDYTITAVNGDGNATIMITVGSKAKLPTGTYVLQTNGI